jgi:parallel beta-helix repeat protein
VNVVSCSFKERVTISKQLTLIGGTIDGTGLGVALQDGALTVRAADVVVQHVRVLGSGGAGIRIEGDRVRVEDSEFDHNIQEGYSVDANDTLFLRTHFHHNNEARTVDPDWEAGGGKSHGERNTFDGCESDHNGGPGIWFDTWYPTPYPPDRSFNPGTVVKNCRVHDNEAGIMYEVSDGATITDNVVWGNGWVSRGWFWSAGILISSSRNVEVARNIVAFNLDGISVLSQGRPDLPGNTVNVNVHDNVVIQGADDPTDTSDKAILAFEQDWSGGIWDAASNNRGSNNRFWSVYPEPRWSRFVWNGSVDTLAKLNATPAGGGSTYLSTAEKDAILASAGIP